MMTGIFCVLQIYNCCVSVLSSEILRARPSFKTFYHHAHVNTEPCHTCSALMPPPGGFGGGSVHALYNLLLLPEGQAQEGQGERDGTERQ